MHYVVKSAEAQLGLRERRIWRTRVELTALARRLTAERGLHGFTVEELCEAVGISRRTFFNYFPTKESAVVGEHHDGIDHEMVDAFMAARQADLRGVSPTLMDDLGALAVSHVTMIGIRPEEASEFMAAVEREPSLLKSFMQVGSDREKLLAELVEKREGLPSGAPVARLAVVALGSLMRLAMEDFMSTGNTRPFDEILFAHIHTARTLFHPLHTVITATPDSSLNDES